MKSRFFILLSILFASCTEEVIKTGDPIPKISFVSLSQTEIVSFQDELDISINYQDGDGDLGSWEADSLDIYVKDSRLNAFDRYHLPPLAPAGANVRIEGTFSLKLKTLFVLGSANSENASFEIFVKDRAGNQSNRIITPSVKILIP